MYVISNIVYAYKTKLISWTCVFVLVLFLFFVHVINKNTNKNKTKQNKKQKKPNKQTNNRQTDLCRVKPCCAELLSIITLYEKLHVMILREEKKSL